MTPLIALLLLFNNVQSILSAEEALFVCRYNGISGFVVPCADARNACQYASSGILCRAQYGPTWNETIVSFRQSLTYRNATNQSIFLPTEIGFLRSLEILTLFRAPSTFYATLPTEIGLCNLSTLRIRDTRLEGTLPSTLFQNTRLVSLDLGGNQLEGTVPSELGLLTSLTTLNFIFNRLSGNFPIEARNLVSLKSITLTLNQLTGPLPDLSAAHSLAYYSVDDNQFSGSSDMPSFDSPSLSFIDISQNRLTGSIPASLLLSVSNTTLFINMRGNQLSGTLPSQLFVPSLTGLDLSYNNLTGSVPKEVMVSANSLEQLELSHNFFSGSLPVQWHDFTFVALFRLALHYNNLSGSLPRFVMRVPGGSPRLSAAQSVFQNAIHLTLNDNFFSGVIPPLAAFTARTEIDLSNNQLALTLDSFGSGRNITWLNMAQNPLGNLSSGLFGNFTRFNELRSLDLSFCQMSGSLPQFFRAQYLKLNNNYFTGVLPTSFSTITDTAFLPAFIDLRLNRMATRIGSGNFIGTVVNFKSLASEVILNDFPQDVDECALNTSECAQLCVDGWFPVPGYTCACESGFKLDEQDKRACHVVCGDGILRFPQEACDYEYSRFGCTRQCLPKPGYRCDGSGCIAICGDGVVVEPEECDSVDGCTPNCTVAVDYTCDVVNNTCQSCTRAWTAFTIPSNLQLFPAFRLFLNGSADLALIPYTSCIACNNKGISIETRDVIASQQCAQTLNRRSLACSFACSNLTVFNSAFESLFTLKQEFERGDFLSVTLFTLYGINVTVKGYSSRSSSVKKRQDNTQTFDRLDFSLSPCTSAIQPPIDINQVSQVIQTLATDIAPNTPNLQTTVHSTCALSLSATDPVNASPYLSALVGLFVAFVVILIVVGLLVYFYRDAALHSLPDDIAWSFKDQLMMPGRWEYQGSSKSGFYSRVYRRESEEFRRVETILTTHFSRGNVKVAEITAIYNKALLVSFVNQWKIMTTRKIQAPEHFFTCTYSKDGAKMAIMAYFQKTILNFWPYNQDLQVSLIPALHGTNQLVAEKIAQTGFASLSSLDSGYYGKGIYFTTSILYTLPYACMHREPALILSYLNMGNVFPVTENHKGDKSLMGTPIKTGYNSHLVLTAKDGTIHNLGDEQGIVCDEIVVGQESQILPAFIIRLDYDSCMTEFGKWERALAAPVTAEETYKNYCEEKETVTNVFSESTYVSLFKYEDNI